MADKRRTKGIIMEYNKRPPVRRSRFAVIAALSLAAVALAGCEGVKDQLGLNPKPPDEFTVVTKAPLSLPPDFSLRPPEPGAARPQEMSARRAARSTVFGTDGKPAEDKTPTDGEKALLTLAGATGVDSSIRRTVNQETAQIKADSESFLDTVIFWREKKSTDSVVDPVKEARRIRENAAAGRPLNEGDTATIKRRE